MHTHHTHLVCVRQNLADQWPGHSCAIYDHDKRRHHGLVVLANFGVVLALSLEQ